MNQAKATKVLWQSLVIFTAATISACAMQSAELVDEVRVTTTSPEIKEVARRLSRPCNNPAEFGRCGCYLDGLLTSCDFVSRCLEVGFCKVATSQVNETETTSESPIYTGVARSLAPFCVNPAEFWRCECTIDGIQTSCDIANRCLQNGFCVKVSQ